MAKHESLGFDQEVMTDSLISLLIRASGATEDDPRVITWRSAAANEEERTRRWHYAWLLGLDHLAQHGFQRSGLLCPQLPCRVAGISAALVQLTAHVAESADPHGILAALDEVTRHLNKTAPVLPALVAFLEKNSDTASPLARATEPAARALLHVVRRDEALMVTQAELLELLESPQFRQADNGRPGAPLLTAMYQHLKETGGFSIKELARLPLTAAEAAGSARDSAATEQAFESKLESIEKLVAKKDQRTWHPYVHTKQSA